MEDLYPVAIVTDSAAGIPETLITQYRIGVVPFWVRVGERSYQDGIDIDPAALFKLMREQEEPDVSTSVPAVETFASLYREAATWARAVVSVHVAGQQSGTCNTAQQAAAESPIPVTVIDTGTTAMAEGFVALAAARAAAAGEPLHAVVAQARAAIPHVGLFALLQSINYAVRGGRLAGAARYVSNLLNLQPLVRIMDNRLSIAGHARRRQRGREQLCEKIYAQVGEAATRLVVHYSESRDEAEQVLETLRAQLNCIEAHLTHVPVALGVHAGPGSLGVAYHKEP